jgi:prepilin-type N-terminal cleavage/methylation domain-containing protein
MITTTARFEQPLLRSSSGFTLVEMLVGMTLALLTAAAIMSSFVFMIRSSHSVHNYAEMNAESRQALEILGRDLRNSVKVTSPVLRPDRIRLNVMQEDGAVKQVEYVLISDASGSSLIRMDAGEERVLMRGIDELNFRYYDLQSAEVTNPLAVKQVQVQVKLLRSVLGLENTERVLSARFILRNKRVSM